MPDPNQPPAGEMILYTTEDSRTRVECRFAEETLWMSQALMAELFQTPPQNITLHLKTLYGEGEIDEAATCKEYLQVRIEVAREVQPVREKGLETATRNLFVIPKVGKRSKGDIARS